MGKRISAIFIGKDKSMKFRHGKEYLLRSEIKQVPGCKVFACICLYDTHSDSWCPYESLESLLENWKIIKLY